MTRREILLGTAGVAVAIAGAASAAEVPGGASTSAVLAPPPKPWAAPTGDYVPVSPQAHALYERALVFDANSGPPGQDTFPLPEAMLALSRNSGVTATKTTMGGINSNFQDTVEEIAWYQRAIEMYPDVFMQVRVADDFARAKREKKLGILFSFESADMFEGRIERIQIFRNLGVRVMQLSYNKHTPWASGVMENPPTGLHGRGQEGGRRNEQGGRRDRHQPREPAILCRYADGIRKARAGHAYRLHGRPQAPAQQDRWATARRCGQRRRHRHLRPSLSDRQPEAADARRLHGAYDPRAKRVRGGSCRHRQRRGLIPWDTSPAGAEEFRKMEEQRQKAGLAAPEEDRPMYVIGLNHNRRPETICDALLKRGYSERVAEKVIGANFIRVLTETWA